MGTIRLHRVLKSSPEKIYRAFLEPSALARWIPPYGFVASIQELDARENGTFRMSFTNFGTGKTETFGGTFLELIPNERIRHTDTFDDPNLPGVIVVTVDLKPVLCGTEIHIEQANLPEAIPLEFCYLGWQESLEQLARLVEPVIPDAP